MRTGNLTNGQISYLDPHKGYREPPEEPATEFDPDIMLDPGPEIAMEQIRGVLGFGKNKC